MRIVLYDYFLRNLVRVEEIKFERENKEDERVN